MIYLFKCITCFESSGTSSTAHTTHTHMHKYTDPDPHNGIEQKTKFGFYITISLESSTSSNGSRGDGIVSYWHSRARQINSKRTISIQFDWITFRSSLRFISFSGIFHIWIGLRLWSNNQRTNQPANHHPKKIKWKKTSCNQILLLVLAEKIGKWKRRKESWREMN